MSASPALIAASAERRNDGGRSRPALDAACFPTAGMMEPVNSTLVPLLLGVLATAVTVLAAQLGAWILMATPLVDSRTARSTNQGAKRHDTET